MPTDSRWSIRGDPVFPRTGDLSPRAWPCRTVERKERGAAVRAPSSLAASSSCERSSRASARALRTSCSRLEIASPRTHPERDSPGVKSPVGVIRAVFSSFASHLPGVWHSIFHLDLTVAEKVLRSVLTYVFLVVALRLVGKRELGQTNTLDLVVLLLIANAVQNGIIGDDLSVTGAVIGAVVLFAINELLNRTTYFAPWTGRVLEGNATYLIRNGKP